MVTSTNAPAKNGRKHIDSLEECLEKIDVESTPFVSFEETVNVGVDDSLKYADVVVNNLDDIDLAGYRQKTRSGET